MIKIRKIIFEGLKTLINLKNYDPTIMHMVKHQMTPIYILLLNK